MPGNLLRSPSSEPQELLSGSEEETGAAGAAARFHAASHRSRRQASPPPALATGFRRGGKLAPHDSRNPRSVLEAPPTKTGRSAPVHSRASSEDLGSVRAYANPPENWISRAEDRKRSGNAEECYLNASSLAARWPSSMNLQDQAFLRRIGDRVRELRTARKLTQAELGESAGLHRTFIGSVERGERNIALLSLHRIALSLRVPITELLAANPTNNEPASAVVDR